MHKYIWFSLFVAISFVSLKSFAQCKKVYAVGAYDKAFSKHATVTKLGPLSAAQVPKSIPREFLEKDGSYGGGGAYCSIEAACLGMQHEVQSGVLAKDEVWHVYLLDAEWGKDVYELHPNDFRIKHSVRVLKRVKSSC